MANPNPVKQQRYVDTQKCIKKAFPGGFTPRIKLPGEALPYASSAMSPTNVYQQPAWVAPTR